MKNVYLSAMVIGLAAVGCESNKSTAPAPAKSPSAAVTPVASAEYYEVSYKGRTYVLGSKASAEKAEKGSHPQLTVTKIGYGVNGETVVFEADKDGNLEKRLMAAYDAKHKK